MEFFIKKNDKSCLSAHSILSILHFSKFLRTLQNRNTFITIKRDSTNFCLSIAHFLSFKGSHFHTNFDGKIARLRWIEFDVRVPLCKECVED